MTNIGVTRDGSTVWRRVLKAIKEIWRDWPREGVAVKLIEQRRRSRRPIHPFWAHGPGGRAVTCRPVESCGFGACWLGTILSFLFGHLQGCLEVPQEGFHPYGSVANHLSRGDGLLPKVIEPNNQFSRYCNGDGCHSDAHSNSLERTSPNSGEELLTIESGGSAIFQGARCN
jgi:hypothetical protein